MYTRCIAAVTLIVIMASASAVNAQVFSDKLVGQKSQALADSLKHSDYPYALPIWGDKATKRGFKLPYSAGISVQYFGQRSDIVIDNLMVGFNNNAMHNLDGLARLPQCRKQRMAGTCPGGRKRWVLRAGAAGGRGCGGPPPAS